MSESPSTKPTHGQRVEERWRQRLQAAKAEYDLASAETRKAMTAFNQRLIPPPDGGANLVNALRTENLARAEYIRLLRIFTDLTVWGKTPPEPYNRAPERDREKSDRP